MINQEFIWRKISLIQQDLTRLKEFENKTFAAIARDWRSYSIVKNLLLEIIGRALDINQHLIAELAPTKTGAPLDYTQTFLKLADLKILPYNFAQKIAKSAGFRNAIVHGYNELDQEIVYHSIKDALNQYKQYCQLIINFLSSEKNENSGNQD